MKTITFTDITLREEAHRINNALNFKEKIEIAKQLIKLNIDAIEFPTLQDDYIDPLLIKTVSSMVGNKIVAIPVGYSKEAIDKSFDAVKSAAHPRLIINVPTSPIMMQYTVQKKAPALLAMISELVEYAKTLCNDVEFSADDATRSEPEFLNAAISAAINAGATSVTICDNEGTMLPNEFNAFISNLYAANEKFNTVALSVQVSNNMDTATASIIEAVSSKATNVKMSASKGQYSNLYPVANIINQKGDSLGICGNLSYTSIQKIIGQIGKITNPDAVSGATYTGSANAEEAQISLDKYDSLSTVTSAVKQLGYELSDEEYINIYSVIQSESSKKKIGAKELDAIVSSTAMQVPPTYILQDYIINSCNIVNSSANIRLKKDEIIHNGISIGDGPIDAAFLAIEQIVGVHYELDDFQIQAVTEGREAMGSTVVKLRSHGKVYSGSGISTDIIGASIQAYLNALNKILYEEG